MIDDGQARLARAWDEAASGYEEYFVPRFAPWVVTAAEALIGVELPPGPVLVPCCGTFPELPSLTAAQPGRELVGIDLSAGMVALARDRAAAFPGVRVEQGDAAVLDPRWHDGCAAVVSVFGLQQLPDPAAALAQWVGALRPGGLLSVVYWPVVTEEEGPFALLASLRRTPEEATAEWEDGLVPAVEAAGGTVLHDEMVAHPMRHPDAETVWRAMAESGPLRALALAQGEQVMAELRERFLAAAPAGEWKHLPHARWIVARRS
ncbi:MAG: class I SAM-dependent methyltransferase [Hamadaea sp.]|nr:class I SAM-dependent methyltransferase [Hamadaea sp.]